MKIGMFTQEELIQKCQENNWLKNNSPVFALEGLSEKDYPFSFNECSNAEELLNKIGKGDWPIRQGFIYNSLAFINQVNGGDEWWALKKFPDGSIKRFESLAFESMIRSGKDWGGRQLAEVISALDKAKSENELEIVWFNKEAHHQIEDEWEHEP